MDTKPSILTESDAEKLLPFLTEDEMIDMQEAKKTIKYLEENYSVNDFPLTDYPEIKEEHPRHICNLYLAVLDNMAFWSENEQEMEYVQKILKYHRNQIRRIEQYARPLEDYPQLGDQVIFFLADSIVQCERIGDFDNMLKQLHKVVDIILKIDMPIYGEDGFRGGFAQLFPEALKRYFEWNKITAFVNHPELMKSYLSAMRYANDLEPCIIVGETGTGKEIIADTIHKLSKRRENNFWAVNCGCFDEHLFNSEVFGVHWSAATNIGTRLGAFLKTYGKDDVWGYYVARDSMGRGEIRLKTNRHKNEDTSTVEDSMEIGGTLFLDEINSMPLGLQSRLLRVIQENEVQVLGEDRKRRFKIKTVCACNTDPSEEIKSRNFREDLYHRISAGIIELPPLRDMKDAIPLMAKLELDERCEKLNREPIRIGGKTSKKLREYDWPGNYRELQNVIYRAFKRAILEDSDELLERHLEWSKRKCESRTNPKELDFSGRQFKDIEMEYAKYLHEQSKGNVSKAATLGGFGSRTSVYTMWKKHAIIS